MINIENIFFLFCSKKEKLDKAKSQSKSSDWIYLIYQNSLYAVISTAILKNPWDMMNISYKALLKSKEICTLVL